MLWPHQNICCFKQPTILALITFISDWDFFDLPLPPFLPAQAQHRSLIDTDRLYPSSARPKKLCTLLLNLNLPGRTFYEVPRILPHGKARIHYFYLYQINRLAVKGNLLNYALSLLKIPSLFINKGLRTIANSRKTTRNDTIIRKSWSR